MSCPKCDEAPIDALNILLDRAYSILVCVTNTYVDDENGFVLPDPHLYNCIWSVSEDLRKAKEAFGALVDEREHLRQAAKRSVA